MNHRTLQQNAGRLNAWLLAIMALVLPLSTSALSIVAILILVVWLVEGGYREKLRLISTNPIAMAVLLYLALYVIGLFWTEDLANGLDVLKKYWKIILLPVFLTTARWEMRRVYTGFFLAGMTIAMTMTYMAWFGLLHYADITTQHLTRGTFHVIYNPMLAFAIYLLCHELVWGKIRSALRWPLAGLAFLMIFNMFITEGRGGQIVFFVLLSLLFLQIFRKNILRAGLIMIFLLPAIFTAGYQFSPVFHGRVDRACSEVQQFKSNPNTSVGLRLLFWQNSWEIIKKNPWLGVGTGDFPSAYAEVNKLQSPLMGATDNPHNQYVFVLCQLGLLGLAALVGIFVIQIRQAFVLSDGWERIRLAFPLFFLTIMFTESYLIIAQTGFLFSLFSAVLYMRNESAETRI
ncbi:MAG: O-antigen ligase family protein [Desulfocapsaceae bacterium]|nr:O-antigen ligase family protein [Desulfocapsaceae bacterium]